MIMDKLAEFCDATALSTVGTGLAAIGNNIDLSTAARNIGQGQQLYLVITVDTAVTSGGSATVEFQVVSDAQDPPAADGTETVHLKTPAFPKATLVQGYKAVFPLPQLGNAFERYFGIEQNVGTAALTAGKINAFLTMDPTGWQAYPEGTN